MFQVLTEENRNLSELKSDTIAELEKNHFISSDTLIDIYGLHDSVWEGIYKKIRPILEEGEFFHKKLYVAAELSSVQLRMVK